MNKISILNPLNYTIYFPKLIKKRSYFFPTRRSSTNRTQSKKETNHSQPSKSSIITIFPPKLNIKQQNKLFFPSEEILQIELKIMNIYMHAYKYIWRNSEKEKNLGVDFGGVGLGLNRLLEVLNIFLNIFTLVLVLKTEGLVFHDLLLLRQVGLQLLLRRHYYYYYY